MKPLIVGSPEAMSKEPSLDPPDEPRKVRKSRMDNYDLAVHIVEIVVKEVGRPFHYDSEFDLYWDELRNPILNLLEKERPEYNQHDSSLM